MNHENAHAWGVQPFWFWNGTIQADEVVRQIRSMKAHGVRGFFLHPRQGMDLPYMSDRFLEMVGVAVDTARHEAMDLWLYDEYPYPSGVAGGELLLNPAYTARVLKSDVFDAQGHVERLLPWGKVLFARAYRLQNGTVLWQNCIDLREKIGIVYDREILQPVGLSSYNQKRFFTGEHAKKLWWDAPEGDWRVFLFCECEMGDFKYFGGFVDPVNPDAMREYLRLTHERYYRVFPEAFGPVIKGIFTDETAPMGHHPMWSPLMPELFHARHGIDLIERLPAFLTATDGDDAKFLYDYHDTLIRAFVDSYDRPIRQWCEAHGVGYVGEKVHMRSEQIRYMHIPGIDSGHVKAGGRPPVQQDRHRANPKTAASYAHFTGDNTALCEAYHSLGWDATLRDMRWIADWLGVQGINLLVPHAYYYTDDSLRKYDAPPSAFESMPWYAHNTLLTAHVERMGELTRNGKRAVQVLVADSAGVAYAYRPGEHAEPSMRCRLEHALSTHHIDYYLIDRDLLSELTAIDGLIHLRGETFRALLLPDMPLAEQEALAAAECIAQSGGLVIAVGRVPVRNITTGEMLEKGFPGCQHAPSPEDCVRMLRECMPDTHRITLGGQDCADILAARFEWEGASWLYAVNLGREQHTCQLSLADTADAPIALVDTITGEAVRVEGTASSFQHRYAPFACALFRTGAASPPLPLPGQIHIDPWTEYTCMPKTANLFRMGIWDADLGGNHVRVDSLPVINQLTVTRSRIEAIEQSDFGCVKRLQFPSMVLRYAFRFVNQYDGPVRLVMEPGSIRGTHTISLNGQPVPAPLETQFIFKRTNLVCDITELLQPGENVLTVDVQAARDDDGVVNPLYLAGDFEVTSEAGEWRILPPRRQASPMALQDTGYPFFSGVMDYDLTELFQAMAGERAEVVIDDWRFEHCAELLLNGVSQGAVAWQPYRWTVNIPSDVQAVLRVHGTMLAAYEGAWFDQDAHQNIFLQRAEG